MEQRSFAVVVTSGRYLRIRSALLGRPVPDLRFEVERTRPIRTFVSIVLLVQAAFALAGALVGGANALSFSSRTNLWSALSVISLSALLFAALRLASRPRTIEQLSLLAALSSLGIAVFGMLQNPPSTEAISAYLAVAVAVAAFAIPWRPVVHYIWAAGATGIAAYGVSTVSSVDERNSLAGVIAFALVLSYACKPIIWNSRVAAHQRVREVRRLNAALRHLSTRDPHTGVGNRVALDEHLQRLAGRSRGRIGLAMIDIDNFKQLNDALGHAAGDATLRQVAELVRLAIRDTDRLFRYGGDEFLAVMERADAAGLAVAAARISAAIPAASLSPGGAPARPVTVSIGMAAVGLPATVEELLAAIDRADQFLYEAKRAGKNRLAGA